MQLDEVTQRRFWAKVGLPDARGCMPWLGGKAQGYGRFCVRKPRVEYAHRVMLFLTVGPPPAPRLEAAHLPEICHRRDCVSPAHLRWATRHENMADKLRDGTHNRGTAHHATALTESDVREIRDLAGVLSHARIAAAYGLSREAVGRIARRDNWSWLQ